MGAFQKHPSRPCKEAKIVTNPKRWRNLGICLCILHEDRLVQRNIRSMTTAHVLFYQLGDVAKLSKEEEDMRKAKGLMH
jgi:hypothetical protein